MVKGCVPEQSTARHPVVGGEKSKTDVRLGRGQKIEDRKMG